MQKPRFLSKIEGVKRIYRTNKGYLISEVIVSIFILILTFSSAITLVVYGYRAINFNRNSLVAGMLVKQCSESIIGLRDTNWLRFSYNKNGCWNMNDITCPGVALAAGNYTLEVSFSGAPVFTQTADDLDLMDGITDSDKTFLLNYFDADLTFDSDGDGNQTNDQDAYTTGVGLGESKFYRIMEITITDGATYIDAVCKVIWQEGSEEKKIEVPVSLTNY